MTAAHRDCTYWMKNEAWHTYDEKTDEIVLTAQAPPEAVVSFQKWKDLNGIK